MTDNLYPTSISIDWRDCGLCPCDSIVRELVTVTEGRITIRQYDGRNRLLVKTEVTVAEVLTADLFLLISDICSKNIWKSEYSVMACDGCEWYITVRFGRDKRKKLKGTVCPPPCGKEISEKIRDMLHDSYCLIEPRFLWEYEDEDEEEEI